jgi:hypothetical protein
VELLFVGAFGAAAEMESKLGILGFHEEMFYGAEELGGFFGEAGGQEEAEDAGVIVPEIDLLAVGEFDGQEMAEVGAEIFESHVAGDEDAPAFGPGLLYEGVEKSRLLRDADEIRGEVGELGALRAFVGRLIFLFRF